jgi:hypothetical protein
MGAQNGATTKFDACSFAPRRACRLGNPRRSSRLDRWLCLSPVCFTGHNHSSIPMI